MAQQLQFALLHHYDSRTLGIDLPILLRSGIQAVEFVASLDTGASYCIFERALGERLGLVIESGLPQVIGSVRGSFLTYGHEILLSVLGIETTATVYFAADETFTRNVLGRQGWLDHVRLGLVDYDSQLYLSDALPVICSQPSAVPVECSVPAQSARSEIRCA